MCREYSPCETAVEAKVRGFKRFDLLGLVATPVFSLFAQLSHSALAGGLIPAPDVSPELAELAETGAISQVTELSNRRRLTTVFTNEQSPFYGVQLNYVNVGLGNLTFLNRDLVRADRVPIVFGRVYDSRKTTGADFGPGWKLSVVEFIQLRGSRLLYADSSGSEYELTINGGRVFSEYSHLTGITDGRFQGNAIELRHSGLHKRFERAENGYRLVEVRDAAGGAIRLRYKAGLVERIWTSHQRFVDLIRLTTNSRPMDYEYDAAGRVSQIRTDGRVATFEYDALGRLAGAGLNGRQLVTSDYGPMDVDAATEADGHSPFTAVAAPVASAIFATDPRGAAALQATFDSAGRVQQVRVLLQALPLSSAAIRTMLASEPSSACRWQPTSVGSTA